MPNVEDGVIFYYSETEKDYVTSAKLSIVDDANVKGKTLAARRLQLLAEGVSLFKFKHAIFFLGDLIKAASPKTYFIDSNGRLFNYKKTTSVHLKFYKIDKIFPIPTGGAVISIEGMSSRFKVLHTPSETIKCAGLLHTGVATILYGLYDCIPENTRRMI